VIEVAGNGTVRNLAKFIDAPNGQRANLPRDVVVSSSLAMLRDLNRAGLTASGGDCTWDDLYREFQKEGKQTMRFFCMTSAPGGRGAGALEKQIAALPTLGFFKGDEWQDTTTYGENIAGGGADNLYAATQAPVTQESWDQFGRFALEVAKAGLPALLHTQTTEAIEGKLQQLEKVNKEVPLRPLRWGLMHMEGVTPPQIERMKKLNMFIGVHPREMVTGGLLHRVHGDKAFAMPPLREIQDSGIMWGLGTDAFEVNQYRPFQTLYWAVTGKMVGGTVVNTHPVSREAALIAHTRNNAHLFFRENDLGSIQAGRFADLVVTDRDYLTVPADQIKDIKPVMTMVGGKVVFDAAAETQTAAR
jgi:predicted amidohydrolase YtcJ